MSPDTHFDAVVVGSGFGGSVSAYRLAQAGQRVCVLERGKAYPPGSFPRRPRAVGRNFWDPSQGLYGLFNVWSFRGIEALVSSGLGGGSLIYANVLMRKDERWFVKERPFKGGYEHWPISRADLEPHYDQVERMLNAQYYPLEAPGYAELAKTRAMREAAKRLGLEWGLTKLAITFAVEGVPPAQAAPLAAALYPNLHGLTRTTCSLCGECDLGCNYGSKNTLDHTYLSAAKQHDADIRVLCEVRRFGPRPGGGYTVSYVEHDLQREGRPTNTAKLPEVTITADRLILAAGALGTPYLLLRNRSAFPHLSPALGTRFCGNGDLLGFMLDSRSPIDGDTVPSVLDGSHGPVITSYIRVPDEVDPEGTGPGYYIEDAGYPVVVDWMVQATAAGSSANRFLRFALRRIRAKLTHDPVSDLSAEITNLLGKAELSAGSMPLLGMGRDVPDGIMRLRKGHLDINWTTKTSKAYFRRVRRTMNDISAALGARFCENPLSLLRRVITVHPLGGCPMGRHEREGVVDAYGQAFGYPGLYVADGSVMPGPVGPNPSLTIAAFANRMAERIVDDGNGGPGGAKRRVARRPHHGAEAGSVSHGENGKGGSDVNEAQTGITGLEFTEEMKGYVTFGELNYERGFRKGKQNGTFFLFHLTIQTDDVDRFIADPTHEMTARGWVECEELGGRLPVENGMFTLFAKAEDRSRTTMRYRLFFRDGAGNPLTLSGFKDIRDDPGFDLWSDTTTLYTKLLQGHVEADAEADAEVSASGIIHISQRDFACQLTTFRTQGPSAGARTKALADFGRLFFGQLWEQYADQTRGAVEATAAREAT